MISCCIWFTPYWRSGVVCWDSALVKWLEKIPTQKLMSVDAPLCCRMCMEKKPSSSKNTHLNTLPKYLHGQFSHFQIIFCDWSANQPNDYCTSSPDSNKQQVMLPCSVCIFLKGSFYIQVGQGKNFPRC